MHDPFEATCSYCGEVAVLAEAAQMYVCTDQRIPQFWSFTCPLCDRRNLQRSNQAGYRTLIEHGVEAVTFGFPAELTEFGFGPPLTTDDLLDFMLALEQEIIPTPVLISWVF